MHVLETLESYGVGLTCFHQFCDCHNVSVAERGHIYGQLHLKLALQPVSFRNDALWFGDNKHLALLKKLSVKAGLSFSCPACGPVTPAHLHVFLGALDLETLYGAAMGSLALVAFRGCRYLDELVLCSAAKFDPKHDTCHDTSISDLIVNSHSCLLTACMDLDIDICPVWAFNNHCRVNHSPPLGTPLFAYRSTLSWHVITKDVFLTTSSLAFKNTGLDQVFRHSYCIGGAMDLLLAGVAPEVIMKLRGWTSLCFLVYWCRLKHVIPAAIVRAWAAQQKEFVQAHNHPSDIDWLLPKPDDETPGDKEKDKAKIAVIVAEVQRQEEIVEAENRAKDQPWPDLMTCDLLLDSHKVLELLPTKERPFHNRVVVHNHHSIFTEALHADLFDFDNPEYETTKTDDIEEQGNDTMTNLPLSKERIRQLITFPVHIYIALQQKGKGKIAHSVHITIIRDGNRMVGLGFGKHKKGEVAQSKSMRKGVRNMDWVKWFEDHTIWTEVRTKFGVTTVILQPRPDISAKVWGSQNQIAVMKATLQPLQAGHAPLGMGDGLGGPGRKLFKGSGLRSKSEIE
ncbi:hypothetical protein DFH08DRAFT_952472 [Mycena albidolilacea]|uniref:S5 DRBM domain-containing protein n=1 Tax=Mycena albidolilacea TaxID=1033008 RepID=A0AAD7AHS5_9AGAR|nr:hypothetical protein DFH08DRAFT_952472 [Mycena albidolilacea]